MISVCMATYNGEKYIREQLDSILCQLSPHDEVIISDDGSKDTTLDIIRAYHDPRIKLFNHLKTSRIGGGISRHSLTSMNFENALKHASGDIIFLSDQDDVWYPGRVKQMSSLLDKNMLVMCDFDVIDSNGEMLRKSVGDCNPIRTTFIGNLWKMPFFGSAIAFRAELIKLALPFPSWLSAHDNWLGLLAFATDKTAMLNTPLHGYRRHGDNVTESVHNPFWYKLRYRAQIAFEIFKRKLHS